MGRPREFDMESTLSNAMGAFWDHGYEATSVTDLMDATGLQKGSLYKAFGDKHGLYIAALEHYLEQTHEYDRKMLEKTCDAKRAIKDWLSEDVMPCCKQSLKRGCLMINAISELSYKDDQVEKLVKSHLYALKQLLTETIKRGQLNKSIRTDVEAKALASLLVANLVGMVTLTKCKTSQSEHQTNISNLMKLLG